MKHKLNRWLLSWLLVKEQIIMDIWPKYVVWLVLWTSSNLGQDQLFKDMWFQVTDTVV